MAIRLKQGKSFTDKHGNVFTVGYGVIKINNCDKDNKSCHLIVDIWKNFDIRDAVRNKTAFYTPLFDYSFDLTQEEFDEYMSPAGVEKYKNQYKAAYHFILQAKDNNDKLIFADWESDE